MKSAVATFCQTCAIWIGNIQAADRPNFGCTGATGISNCSTHRFKEKTRQKGERN